VQQVWDKSDHTLHLDSSVQETASSNLTQPLQILVFAYPHNTGIPIARSMLYDGNII
jgi:hypothetical protein